MYMKALSIRITPEQSEKLAIMKSRWGISANQAIRYAIAYMTEHTAKVAEAYPFMQETRQTKGK